MKLLQIKATSSPEKVNLILDDLVLPFPVELISSLNLSKNMDISTELFQQLSIESVRFALYNYSLRQVGMISQTEINLQKKLSPYQKKYLFKTGLSLSSEIQSANIVHVIDRIRSLGLLNPDEFVRSLIRRYQGRKSRQEIVYRLQQAGIDPKSYDLESMGLEDETAAIQKLITKKIKSVSDLTDFKTKNKVIAYLARKGFSVSSVKTVIDDLLGR